MKATFLFSRKTGSGRFLKHLPKIMALLEKRFDEVTYHETADEDDFADIVQFESGIVDVIVFSGGDGAFNKIVNVLMHCKKRPALLYLPGGTINDIARTLKIPFSYKRAIKIFDRNKLEKIDICKINEDYFVYVAAIGRFVAISYLTKRKHKKFFGKLAYYFIGMKEAFRRKKPFEVTLEIDGKEYHHTVPFLLVVNGESVSGVKINKRYQMDDGKFEIYATKPGIFGGTFHYLFGKVKTYKYRCDNVKITSNCNDNWCIDGERGKIGEVVIKSIPRAISVYTGRKK